MYINPAQKITKIVNREHNIPQVLQTLFVSTGCDFISYFTGFGMATFLNNLYEYCSFICTDTDHIPGLLSIRTMDFFHLLGWLGVRI